MGSGFSVVSGFWAWLQLTAMIRLSKSNIFFMGDICFYVGYLIRLPAIPFARLYVLLLLGITHYCGRYDKQLQINACNRLFLWGYARFAGWHQYLLWLVHLRCRGVLYHRL